jgi:hypothetical protein
MKIKKLGFGFLIIFIAGCSLGMEHPSPSVNVGPSAQSLDADWKPYQAADRPKNNLVSDKGQWNGDSAWKYPPAASSERNDLMVKPVADMESKPLPEVSNQTVSGGFPNVASSTSLWVDQYVPAVMREDFDRAAKEASYRGSSVLVDEETGNHFVMSRVWQAGKCSGIDINLMSPGGKLPVISRGSTEICS